LISKPFSAHFIPPLSPFVTGLPWPCRPAVGVQTPSVPKPFFHSGQSGTALALYRWSATENERYLIGCLELIS
jgi:hypothetical protein